VQVADVVTARDVADERVLAGLEVGITGASRARVDHVHAPRVVDQRAGAPFVALGRGQIAIDRHTVVQPQDHHLVRLAAVVLQLHRHAAGSHDLAVHLEREVRGVDLQ
jgi:hypothetical protein